MAPTEVAGRYRIERRLGAGGMSTVFEATDMVLERSVAVKLLAEHLAEDEAFVARFRREALAAARLQHPNIVQVFDSGRDPESDRHYIVMEYVDGPSCADLLRETKQLEIERTVEIVRDACHGLDYAHRAGVIHRDVKPGNLLVAQETSLTKLADFGIAKAAEQTRITQVGSVLGTAAYLSPEQARGDESGPASDIYSLGVCAYQFLAGRLPHEYGSLTELALKQQEESVEPIAVHRPDVPPELDRAIRLCLEREPENRYASGLELVRAMEAGMRGETTEATRRLDATRHPTAARRAAVGGAGAGAAAREMDATAATRMLRTGTAQAPPHRAARPSTPAPSRREAKQAERGAAARRGGAGRRWGTFLAVLLLILAIGAVGLVLLSESDPTSVQPVDRNDVQQQIDGLRDFLREHSP